MGIELYPKFLSLTGTRCYHPLCESIVAKCCQGRMRLVTCPASRAQRSSSWSHTSPARHGGGYSGECSIQISNELHTI